ncbi:unnamed protein product [Allacma fusca]|uniref:Uncharacterized protein n=1 Tax=Allacma fusca TaxID=39272 RepID=A0A8J2JL32_9HEXA|nr:unnamed protein product [Allacma fusca]
MELLILKTVAAVVDVILLMSYPPGNFRQLNFGGGTTDGISGNSSRLPLGHSSNGTTAGLNYTLINKVANEAIFGVVDWWSGAEGTTSANRKSWTNSPPNVLNLDEWINPQKKIAIDNLYAQFRKYMSNMGCTIGRLLHDLPGGTFLTYHLVSTLPSSSMWDELLYPFQQAAIFGSDCVEYEYLPFTGNDKAVLESSLSIPAETTRPLHGAEEVDDQDNRLYKRHSVKIRK